MEFLIKEIKLKFNFNQAIEYLNEVENNFLHLKWHADSNLDTIYDADLQDNIKGVYGWGIQSNLDDLSKPCPPYNIHKQRTDIYQNTPLVFGFAKWLLEIFPYARQMSIAAHPPGTKIRTHIDTDTWLKIHIPLISNNKSYFVFNDNLIVMHPGKIYLVNTSVPHSTINNGESTRVHLFFKIPADKIVEIMELNKS